MKDEILQVTMIARDRAQSLEGSVYCTSYQSHHADYNWQSSNRTFSGSRHTLLSRNFLKEREVIANSFRKTCRFDGLFCSRKKIWLYEIASDAAKTRHFEDLPELRVSNLRTVDRSSNGV
jgi:hypothetical protein